MVKRVSALLLGLGLAGLGVLLLVSPSGSGASLAAGYWPLFLALAGAVRVAGYLIDRHPKSPVGGLTLATVGIIIFCANRLGHNSILLALSKYWFWFLLAFIAGRLMKQYLYRPADGGRAPRAFSPAAILGMFVIASSGLAADYAVKHGRQSIMEILQIRDVHRLGKFEQLGDFLLSDQIAVEDPIQSFDITSGAHLRIDGFKGAVEINSAAQPQATARLIKRVHARDQQEATSKTGRTTLKIAPDGRDYRFALASTGADDEVTVNLILTLPQQIVANLEINDLSGPVKLSDLRGNHLIRNGDQIDVLRNAGTLRIENPRGDVSLEQIKDAVAVLRAGGSVTLQDLSGPVEVELEGDELKAENLAGPLDLRASEAKLTLHNIGRESETTRSAIRFHDLRDCRLELGEVFGDIEIKGQRTRIEADRLKGEVVITNSDERILARRIEGSLLIKADNSAVTVEEMLGSARIETSRDVNVQDFSGPLVVRTIRGSIKIKTDKKFRDELSAQTEQGRIWLSLPSRSPFRLDAGAVNGRVRFNGFDDFTSQRAEKSTVQGYNLNDSSPLISLRTGSGNIQFRSSGGSLQDAEDEQARN